MKVTEMVEVVKAAEMKDIIRRRDKASIKDEKSTLLLKFSR